LLEYLDRLRGVLGFLVLLITFGAALLAWLPTPTFGLWIAHFIAVELGRWWFFCGIAAALAIRRPRWRIAALLVGVVVAIPGERTRYYVSAYPAESPAQEALAAVTVESDVELGPTVSADLFHPEGATAEKRPLVVVVHGGSWRSGDKGEVPHVSRALAAAGARVADLRYRLAPEHPHPAALADVKCAIGRLRARADVDDERVFLLGRSAGAHLALLASLTAGLPELPPACPVVDRPVAGVAGLYPTTDLVFGDAAPPSPDPIDNRLAIRDFLGFSAREEPVRAAAASPVKYADRVAGLRVLLIHGEADHLVPAAHSERLAAALRSAGYPPELHLVPGADHAFDHHPGGPADAFATGRILALVFGATPAGPP